MSILAEVAAIVSPPARHDCKRVREYRAVFSWMKYGSETRFLKETGFLS
ncbi:MAG: hypothetical protein MUC60_11535 [Oscillatoria sp. Prado101]|jgi:hypothetical protein|nr:hypothetical protein [Oscillatoria sp. Prado101]